MTHIQADQRADGADVPSHIKKKWLPAAGQTTAWVNKVSGRGDLIAKLGPGLGNGAPACFTPHIAEIEVDTSICLGGVDPAEVDLDDRKFRLGKSPFVGAISHEAAHAKWSAWVPAQMVKAFPELNDTKRVLDVFVTLDESRIEAHLVRHSREMRDYLKACAGHIVARDFKISDDPYGASIAAALLLARVDAGVFDESDVKDIRAEILTKLDQDTLDKLRPLWVEFQSLSFVSTPGDSGTLRGIEIAKEWLDVLGVEHDDPTENMAIIVMIDPSMGEGEGKDGKGEGSGSGFGESIKEGATEASMDAEGENIGEKKRMVRAEHVKATQEEGKRREKAKKAAAKVFHRDRGEKDNSKPEGGGGHGWGPGARRRLMESRKPTDNERRAAVAIARALERVQYRDRAVVKRTSIAPPGRIRGRGAVLRAAQKKQGAIMTAEPWTAKRRAHTDEPPLTVGIMTDLSGSMSGAAPLSGALSWVMSESVRRIHGKVATVLFGAEVHGVVSAGERQDKVNIFGAHDGFEAFKDGFEALEGELDLLTADGARLLVVFSDAHFVDEGHAEYANKAMGWCRERGVAVVWCTPSGHFYTNHGWGEIVDASGKSPSEVAGEIGKVAIEAVRKANARRQAAG